MSGSVVCEPHKAVSTILLIKVASWRHDRVLTEFPGGGADQKLVLSLCHRNTCPMCRMKLFEKPNELAGVIKLFRSASYKWDDFDIPEALAENIPHIQPVTCSLIPSVLTVPEHITTQVDCRLASSALVLAGNTAIAVARVREDPLSDDEMMDYRHIVKAMYTFLESKDGEEMQVR